MKYLITYYYLSWILITLTSLNTHTSDNIGPDNNIIERITRRDDFNSFYNGPKRNVLIDQLHNFTRNLLTALGYPTELVERWLETGNYSDLRIS
jgi:hypothetical protein